MNDGSEVIFPGIEEQDVPKDVRYSRGKVRDILDTGDKLIIITSDRISAFDRVLGYVPRKGEVLNRLSAFWFDATKDVCDNHFLEVISPRSMLTVKCRILPIEVVVRGYLTGSAWRDYQKGKTISGISLPSGLKMNQRFPEPIITPTTKETEGRHDQPISGEEIVSRELLPEKTWIEVKEKALALYKRGAQMAGDNGLILVDTKYEFGLINDNLILADELHTPDSSRFWYADTYEELYRKGKKQRKLDKEYLRQWLLEQGYSGGGEPPEIPREVFLETGERYIRAYQEITGKEFKKSESSFEAEKKKILSLIDKE
jgi:phosphoribosylaminoimidazole-succinocarboxamide synthase